MSVEAYTQGSITDMFKSTQGRTQTYVRDPIEIILGSSIANTDCTLMNIVVCFESANHYACKIGSGETTNRHFLQILAELCVAAFTQIISPTTATYEPTTNVTEALVLYNLGRLMRETINDDTFISTIQDLDDELRTSVGGTLKTDSNGWAAHVATLWWAIGKGLDDMFGDWSFTEWKPNDDALAGLWMVWFYVLFHWGVQVTTYFSSDYLRGIGEYVTQGGAIEGRLKKLDPYNEKDWPLRFLNGTNGSGDVFGLTAAMVDNEGLKGIQIPLFDQVEPFIKKYFSRSRWIWRYMRWVDVSPIYTIMPPKVADKNAPAANTAVSDFEYMALFESKTNCDWDWWNTYLLNFTQRLQRFKFRGKNGGAFGKLKSRIKLVNVFDLPEPGVGKGGLFWHQMTSARIDVDVGGDDNFFIFKYRGLKEGSDLDYTPELAPDALHYYRDKMQFYWYQLIGLIEQDMFHFLLGVHTTRAYKRDGSTVAYITGTTANGDTNNPTAYNYAFSPCGIVTFQVLKDEDENYYLNETPASYTFEPMEFDSAYTLLGKAPMVYEWSNVAELTTTSSDNFHYSVHELNLTRTDYLPMRSSDPYKKLKHVVYDVHNLDFVNIRDTMANVYIGGVPATKDLSISAMSRSDALSQRKDGDTGGPRELVKISAAVDDDTVEKVDDDVSKISAKDEGFDKEEKISALPEEVKISVTPEEIKKIEKQLKLKKEQLKKQKDKEAKAAKQGGKQ